MRSSIYTRAAASDTGSGAAFLIVLTLLIVFYIIFLPPEEREALLENDRVPGGTTPGTTPGQVIDPKTQTEFIFAGPGPMTRQARTDFTHTLGSFILTGEYESVVLAQENAFLVRSTLFQTRNHVVRFELTTALEDTQRAFITFNMPKQRGTLLIFLNGQTIFAGDMTEFNSGQIQLPHQYLRQSNELEFRVSAPGSFFWRSNEYQIQQLRVHASTIDRSKLTADAVFDVREVEVRRLQSANIRFVIDCVQGKDKTGMVTITFNGHDIFSSVPDCGAVKVVTVPRSALEVGQNYVKFTAQHGVFVLDQVQFKTILDADEGVTYFFDLDPKYFITVSNTSRLRSEYQLLSEFLFVDDNRDHIAELVINGYRTNIDTTRGTFVRDITTYAKPHNNYIQIIPKSDFSLVQARVYIARR